MAEEFDPEYLWSLAVPIFGLIMGAIVAAFIIVRKIRKRRNYDRLLEETYNISRKAGPAVEEREVPASPPPTSVAHDAPLPEPPMENAGAEQ